MVFGVWGWMGEVLVVGIFVVGRKVVLFRCECDFELKVVEKGGDSRCFV